MKIAINGNYVDVRDIIKIDSVIVQPYDEHGYEYKFLIHFYNEKTLQVGFKDFSDYHDIFDKLEYIYDITLLRNKNSELFREFENSQKHQDNIKKINDFKETIVKIWSENQSEIPQFNL